MLLAGCKPSQRELTGTVFIAARTGEVFKLAAVEIKVVSAPEALRQLGVAKGSAAQLIPQLQQEYDLAHANNAKAYGQFSVMAKDKSLDPEKLRADLAAMTRWNEARAKNDIARAALDAARAEAASGTAAFYEEWPQVITTTLTDADGAFKIAFPADREVMLVAKASRLVGKEEEKYFWCVPVSATHKGPFHLNNANLLNK